MKIRVGVIFGGESVEHEVSIISAIQAMHKIDEEKYEVIPIYITKDREWYTGDMLKEIDVYQDFNLIKKYSDNVVLYYKNGSYVLQRKTGLVKSVVKEIDIAFPIVHGTNVEDGVLTGFLQTLGLPVVGCDVLSSAVGMNKYVMKTVLKDNGISVLDCKCYTWTDYEDADALMGRIEEAFKYPVIIKPINLGSSIGISKAGNREELSEALELAFEFSRNFKHQITRHRKMKHHYLFIFSSTNSFKC